MYCLHTMAHYRAPHNIYYTHRVKDGWNFKHNRIDDDFKNLSIRFVLSEETCEQI